MANFELMRELTQSAKTKIVLLVMDGLGGLPIEAGGKTELESAHTPNMDRLAAEGTLGRLIPVEHGVAPGSGPAHLGLFGYDPLVYPIGRGVLESFGVGLPVGAQDVAVRGNFVSLDENGLISDRRAGRISSAAAAPLVEKLKQIQLPGVEVEVKHVQEYRFAAVMRGVGLSADLNSTDPQKTGVAPLPVTANNPSAQASADLWNQWIAAGQELLKNDFPANGFTLRGFSGDPQLPTYAENYKLNAACVAVYPMYRGLAKLVGMDVQNFPGNTPEDEFNAVAKIWNDFDFFFIHIKYTDSRGEDGKFAEKAAVIEQVDAALPILLGLKPDVLLITGDHSTPAKLKSHSWHPVPLLLWAPATHLPDLADHFGERACMSGGLGTMYSRDLMPVALAHAGRLQKYGA
ncbi:MAG TPA: 2,3-bisphosphoglycerate-independent phosphoglycerate mutase [Anaerolineales bacterium]|nr:2,3-bisphosphoglycerate-independent phosphoglycerate mutase [Anaerolineales bacterium]